MEDLNNNLIADPSIASPTPQKRFLTAREAANEYFNGTVSYWKILDMAKQNLIPHFPIQGRVLFCPSSLDQWVADIEIRPNPDTHREAQKRLSS